MLEPKDSILWRFGQTLHSLNDDITRQPLPRRWVDLIHHLNEKDRLRSEAIQSSDKTPYTGVCLVGDIRAGRITDVQVTACNGHSNPMPLKEYLDRNLSPAYETLLWCEDLQEKLPSSI